MKTYERRYQQTTLDNRPFVLRVDGRNFSSWTRNLETPSFEFLDLMREVTGSLLYEMDGAVTAYTQSDEISLVFYLPHYKSNPIFGGRVQKLASIGAATATAQFNKAAEDYIGELDQPKQFDGRVFGLPSLVEAYNYLLWRESNATTNSIRMIAQKYYSDNELFEVSDDEAQEMIFQAGENWNDYPAKFKRGSYFVQKKVEKTFGSEELKELPEQHHARQNPDEAFEVTIRKELDVPPITQLDNPGVVLFGQQIEL